MLAARLRFASIGLACIVGGLLATRLGTADPSSRTLLFVLAVSTAAACLLAARFRYGHAGVADPLFLFSVGFLLYNALIPIQVALRDPLDPIVLANVYGASFGVATYVKVTELAFLASVSLLVVTIALGRGRRTAPNGNVALDEPASGDLFVAGVCTFGFGMLLTGINLVRTGGLVSGLLMERSQRFSGYAASRGSIPYVPFVISGLALLWTAHFRSEHRRLLKWAIAASVLWTAINLALGDRRWVFYAGLIVLASGEASRPFRFRLTSRALAALLLLYTLAAGFAQVRYLVSPILNRETSVSTALNQGRSDASLKWLLPSNNEFAAPYFTTLSAIAEPQPLAYGATYVRAVTEVLPQTLSPVEKGTPLAERFARRIHDRFTPYDATVNGFGLSPLAEGYLNFGAAGAVAEVTLAALFLGLVSKVRWRSSRWQFLSVVLLPQAFVFNRLGFALVEGTWFLIAAVVGWELVKFLRRIRQPRDMHAVAPLDTTAARL